jgi:hypothetical protein
MKTKAEKIKTILEKVYGSHGQIFITQWKIDEATRLIMQVRRNKLIKKS